MRNDITSYSKQGKADNIIFEAHNSFPNKSEVSNNLENNQTSAMTPIKIPLLLLLWSFHFSRTFQINHQPAAMYKKKDE